MAFIQPSTHKIATGTLGDEHLAYITLAMHQESDTVPNCLFGRAGNLRTRALDQMSVPTQTIIHPSAK